jgi:hypothetical protein
LSPAKVVGSKWAKGFDAAYAAALKIISTLEIALQGAIAHHVSIPIG